MCAHRGAVAYCVMVAPTVHPPTLTRAGCILRGLALAAFSGLACRRQDLHRAGSSGADDAPRGGPAGIRPRVGRRERRTAERGEPVTGGESLRIRGPRLRR